MPFRYTINAYRGCSHGCRYCFARPTHDYLGFNIAEDFDSRIVVKVNAVARARAELGSRHWRGDWIAMGTNTDPYQKAEARYHLTRGLIQVLADAANPFSILTKSTLVLRDIHLLPRSRRTHGGRTQPLDRHARHRRLATPRTRHAATDRTPRGGAAVARGGHPLRCPHRSRRPRTLRRRRTPGSDHQGVQGRWRNVGSSNSSPSAAEGSRALSRLPRRATTRSARALSAPIPKRLLSANGCATPHRVDGRPSVRRRAAKTRSWSVARTNRAASG